ncbi:hypothetical protein OV203_02470 [Nannocystis sp. ILAH1]|uniref:hypothetical protein n=1 Tax=Nannocystis sp. ILAH1 TaxID=2996789 RepID=UPI0022720E24|nr:hypothetical protein [Nannocystis sp. ILAH1]MCY0985976.1 hypothetical protein [Nannocystis sp. ILAH1]
MKKPNAHAHTTINDTALVGRIRKAMLRCAALDRHAAKIGKRVDDFSDRDVSDAMEAVPDLPSKVETLVTIDFSKHTFTFSLAG